MNRKGGRSVLVLVLVLVLAAFGTAPAAALIEDRGLLALTAVGHNGSFFDVTVAAGSSSTLQVALNNQTESPIAVRSFAATVYSITNGGFGAREAGTPASGATLWVDYADTTFILAPDPATTRSFRVSVPAGTAPGEYVSSIVLQNDVPIAGSGDVALDRVIRQVVAISIRVPGLLAPSFTVEDVSHRLLGGNSSVAVGISNTGNQHLYPEGLMVLRDDANREISQAAITMGSLYAHSESGRVAAIFDGELDPGDYTVSMTLTDPETGASASIDGARFTVAEAAASATSRIAQLPQILRAPTESPGLVVGALVAGLLGLAFAFLGWRRAKRVRAAAARAAELVSVGEPVSARESVSESVPGALSPESAAADPAADRP
ncbi:hypothetical protein [Cryobacterium sp. Y29]|uniref:hypothetical protein n=1 Tax=Cryobacterium sp. Y29 TaxID=2048285 RepID=UPI000CE50DAA|nr:hypothetical protein [Cryobacterium sp. Y29]